jgi:hypothetical protein
MGQTASVASCQPGLRAPQEGAVAHTGLASALALRQPHVSDCGTHSCAKHYDHPRATMPHLPHQFCSQPIHRVLWDLYCLFLYTCDSASSQRLTPHGLYPASSALSYGSPWPPLSASPAVCSADPMPFDLKVPAHLLVQMMYTSKCGLQVDGSFHQIASGHLV